MRSADLTPEQWEQFDRVAIARWRDAFKLCEHVVAAGFELDDPMYFFCGSYLAAACDLRRLAAAGRAGEPLPKIGTPMSMMIFVKPHTGGGAVPGAM